jgi:hypothetical protein
LICDDLPPYGIQWQVYRLNDAIEIIECNIENVNDDDVQVDELDAMLNDYFVSSTSGEHRHDNELYDQR